MLLPMGGAINSRLMFEADIAWVVITVGGLNCFTQMVDLPFCGHEMFGSLLCDRSTDQVA